MSSDQVKPVSKAAAAYDSLRRSIVRGELRPGQRVTLKVLSELLGMSLTPVREALNRLVAEGYAVHDPHHGTFIAEQSRGRIEQVYRLRAVLESMAVGLAAEWCASLDEERNEARRTERERIDQLLDAMDDTGDPLQRAEMNERFHQSLYRLGGDAILLGFIEQLWAAMPYPSQRIYLDQSRERSSHREHREIADAVFAGDADRSAELMRVHIDGGRRAALAAVENDAD